jgi:hypothetical protein
VRPQPVSAIARFVNASGGRRHAGHGCLGRSRLAGVAT